MNPLWRATGKRTLSDEQEAFEQSHSEWEGFYQRKEEDKDPQSRSTVVSPPWSGIKINTEVSWVRI